MEIEQNSKNFLQNIRLENELKYLDELKENFIIEKEKSEKDILINIWKKNINIFKLTIKISSNYPLIEPEIKFKIISKDYNSIFIEDKYLVSSYYLGKQWKPLYKLSEIILKADNVIKKSLHSNNEFSLNIMKIFFLVGNLLFILFVILNKKSDIFYQSGNINEENPIYIVFLKFKNKITNHFKIHSFGDHEDSHVFNILEAVFRESYIFNVFYFLIIYIFFYLINTKKSFRLKNSTFYTNILLIISNPISIDIFTNHHPENLGLIFYFLSFILIIQKEYEISILCYFFSHIFFSFLINLTFLSYFFTLIISILLKNKNNFMFLAKIKNVFKLLFAFIIYFGFFLFFKYELQDSEFETFFNNFRKNIYENIFSIRLIFLIPLIYSIKISRNLSEFQYYNVAISALILYSINQSRNLEQKIILNFISFLLNIFLTIKLKNNNKELFFYFFIILSSDLLLEKTLRFKVLTISVQIINFAFLFFRNYTFLKNHKKKNFLENLQIIFKNILNLENIVKIGNFLFKILNPFFSAFLFFIMFFLVFFKINNIVLLILFIYFAIILPLMKFEKEIVANILKKFEKKN